MSNKYLDLDGAKYMLQKYHDKVSNNSQLSNPFDSAPINTGMHSFKGNIFGDKWMAWNETKSLNEFDPEFENTVMLSNSNQISTINPDYHAVIKYYYPGTENYVYMWVECPFTNDGTDDRIRLVLMRPNLNSSSYICAKYSLQGKYEDSKAYTIRDRGMVIFNNYIYMLDTSGNILKMDIPPYPTQSTTYDWSTTYTYDFYKIYKSYPGHLFCDENKLYVYMAVSGSVSGGIYGSTDGSNWELVKDLASEYPFTVTGFYKYRNISLINRTNIDGEDLWLFSICVETYLSGKGYRYITFLCTLDDEMNFNVLYETDALNSSEYVSSSQCIYLKNLDTFVFRRGRRIVAWNRSQNNYFVVDERTTDSNVIGGCFANFIFLSFKTAYDATTTYLNICRIDENGVVQSAGNSISAGKYAWDQIYIDPDLSILFAGGSSGTADGKGKVVEYDLYGGINSELALERFYYKYKK